MSTTSTIPTVKAQLVTVFTSALATASTSGGQVQVSYAWPGTDNDPEAVFLGYHPGLRDIRLEAVSEIPTIKAGRKQRQEEYQIPVTIWTFRPDLSADGASTVEAQAFTLLGHLEDELADDPQIGLAQGIIHWARLGDYSTTLWPWQKGWACELVFEVNIEARLT